MGSVENLVLLGNSLLYNRLLWPLALETLRFPPLPYLVAMGLLVPGAHLLYGSRFDLGIVCFTLCSRTYMKLKWEGSISK